jgi:hypothetical protein
VVAGNSEASGDGLKQVVAGETGKFQVQTKDSNKNLCDFGGNAVAGKISGPAEYTASVTDNNNGTYDGSYVPTVAGKYKAAISVDGGAVGGSPFSVTVVPAQAVAAETLASGKGLANAVAGIKAGAVVQARDEFQNESIHGGDQLTGSISGPAGEQSIDVKDYDNGKYRVQYTGPDKAGTYKLSIKLNGQDIQVRSLFFFFVLFVV